MLNIRDFLTRSLGLLLIGAFFMPISVGVAGPESKDHPFNFDVPTQFNGDMIALMAGKKLSFVAYEANPKEDTGKAILLIHEWWGLNEHIKSVADQLAGLGYHALAIDLYNEQVAYDPADADQYRKQVKEREANKKITAALRYLSLTSDKVATMGWCFGGGWSLNASLNNPSLVDATIIYYGALVTEPVKLKALKSPVLGIFAKKDAWITPAWVMSFETALNAAGVENQIYSYDADHAFANPSNDRYDEEAYIDAWDKTLTFLRKYL